jgi:hypothetical protein
MQIVKVNLGENHFINMSGDWHKGTKLHDAGAVEQTIEDTLQPDTFFVGMGDLVEAITVDDKRYESKLHKKTVIEQYDDVEEIVKRVKSKTILHLMGNHDWTLSRRYGDMVESMCKSLKVKYGDYSSVICVYADPGYPISPRDNKDLELEYLLYKIYVNHGFGSIQSRIDSTSERKHSVDRSLRRKLFMKFDDYRVMAMGHCFSEDTEALTLEGWKNYQNLNIGDKILTFNMETSQSEWQPIENKYVYQDKFDNMLFCENRVIDFGITHDHRVIFKTTGKNWKEDIAKNVLKYSQIAIPVAAPSGLPEYQLSDDKISLLGWLVSEGHFRENGAVQLFQSWSKKDKIEGILQSLGIKYSLYRRKFEGKEFFDPKMGKYYKTKEDCATFYITIEDSKPIIDLIQEKNIPSFAFKFSDRQFLVLLKSLIAGDGEWQNEERSGSYYTGDKSLADNLQALSISHGWRANVKKHKEGWRVLLCNKPNVHIFSKNSHIPKNPWKEDKATKTVWCVTVPNSTLFVRRNGKVCVLGNTHRLVIIPPSDSLGLHVDQDGAKGKEIHSHYAGLAISENGYIPPEGRWYVNTGGYLRMYGEGVTGYSEVRGYDPLEIGYARIICEDGEITNIKRVVLG